MRKSKTSKNSNPTSTISKKLFNNIESSMKQQKISYDRDKDNLIIWLHISKIESKKINKIQKEKENSHTLLNLNSSKLNLYSILTNKKPNNFQLFKIKNYFKTHENYFYFFFLILLLSKYSNLFKDLLQISIYYSKNYYKHQMKGWGPKKTESNSNKNIPSKP